MFYPIESFLLKNLKTKKYMKMARAYIGSKVLEKAASGTTWKEVWSAGQGVGLIDEILPAAEIVATYERALETHDTNEIWAALFTDVEMQRPADAMREAHGPHGPTYSYLFGWPAARRGLGACHGIDIPFTFGNFVDGWGEFVGADDAALALGRTLRDSWAAFAHHGDPRWPGVPATMRFARDSTVVDDPLRDRLSSLGSR